MEVMSIWYNLEWGPCKDHSCQVWFQLAELFQIRIFFMIYFAWKYALFLYLAKMYVELWKYVSKTS